MPPPPSQLDGNQILQGSYDDATGSLRVNATVVAPASIVVTQGTTPWVISGTVSANQSGIWNINDISGTISLPTNAAQETGGHLESIDTKLPFGLTVSATRLLVDGSGVIQPVSGTVTANQGTSPWVDNISQFGGSNVVTGTGISGLGIPRVTISNDSNILVTQSGTWDINNITGTISLPTGAATETTLVKLTQTQGSTTSGQSGPLVQGAVTTADPTYTTAQTDPISLTTTGRLRTDVTGNVASAATDSGNPVKIGTITNLGGSLFTDGQRANAQSDLAGSLYVDIAGRLPTYSSFSSFTVAATATDIFTLTGSSTKTIKIKSVIISGTNTGNTNALIILLKRSTANSGGTSTTLTAVPHDSNSSAATATARSYTANPTIGTLVGNIMGQLLFLPTLSSTNVSGNESINYDKIGGQPIILRGTGEVFSVNLNGTSITGTTVMDISVHWTEE